MRTQKLTFNNQRGLALAARLDSPLIGEPLAYALFAHCFTCSKNFKAVTQISRALTQAGIAVLRFDFTGLGESEGDFSATAFSSNVEDLLSAAEFLAQHYQAPKILIGHSLGGTAILRAASRIESALAVATIASPYAPQHVLHLLGEQREQIERLGKAEVNLAGRPFTIKKEFIDDLTHHDLHDDLRHLRKALLVFHSPVDNTVSIDNAQEIFIAAKHPKSFISLDRADHLLSREEDSLYVGTVIAAWARKYLDLAPAHPQVESTTVITRTGKEGFLTEIHAAGHSLIGDEPIAIGGGNLGPSPYDYLCAALGSCTGMTLRLYADRKAWPLDSVEVRLEHKKIHAVDCSDCETKNGQIDVITRSIQLTGPLDHTQKQKLLEIADKCPVHRSLHSEVKIRTQLIE